jgi:uncharacterized protein
MKTLVVGVAAGADRYANMAVSRLKSSGHEVVALGIKEGEEQGLKILTGTPELEGIHTVTLYINPTRQGPMIDYLLSLRPQRIIFNPGTENPEFMSRAEAQGIEAVHGCTLVMLGTGQF